MMDIVNPLETDLNLSYNINKQALAMFHQKATRAADKMETLGMLDERGDLFSLMQSSLVTFFAYTVGVQKRVEKRWACRAPSTFESSRIIIIPSYSIV